MRLIDHKDLKAKGIKSSKTKIWRQVKNGLFPKPVKIGDRNAWVEAEVDAYIKGLIAVRDSAGVRSYGLVMIKAARDRQGEEQLVSQLLLQAIATACGVAASVPLDTLAGEQVETAYETVIDPIARLLDGTARTVLVAPDGVLAADQPVSGAILSASFNPLHAGHERLAQAAAATLGMPVTFELPILNADKAPLSYAEIERRLAQLLANFFFLVNRRIHLQPSF